MSIEIEKSPVSILPMAVIVGLCIGGLIGISKDLCTGSLVGCFAIMVGQSFADAIDRRNLPVDAELCAKAAVDRFRAENPDTRIVSVAVRDTNEERFIISVRYDGPHIQAIPTARTYYAVRRTDQAVTLEDRRMWWPKGLK